MDTSPPTSTRRRAHLRVGATATAAFVALLLLASTHDNGGGMPGGGSVPSTPSTGTSAGAQT